MKFMKVHNSNNSGTQHHLHIMHMHTIQCSKRYDVVYTSSCHVVINNMIIIIIEATLDN